MDNGASLDGGQCADDSFGQGYLSLLETIESLQHSYHADQGGIMLLDPLRMKIMDSELCVEGFGSLDSLAAFPVDDEYHFTGGQSSGTDDKSSRDWGGDALHIPGLGNVLNGLDGSRSTSEMAHRLEKNEQKEPRTPGRKRPKYGSPRGRGAPATAPEPVPKNIQPATRCVASPLLHDDYMPVAQSPNSMTATDPAIRPLGSSLESLDSNNATVTLTKSGVPRKRKAWKPWTNQENQQLIDAVRLAPKTKPIRWGEVAKSIGDGTRLGSQCRERWSRVLDPSISKKPWTPEELRLLDRVVAEVQVPSKRIPWSAVAKKIPGRTDIQCRYQYTTGKKLAQETNKKFPSRLQTR